MKRLVPYLLMLATALFGAPSLGATSNDFPQPVVIVYPLTQTSGSGSDAGSNIAILLATKLGQLGGITVKPFTPGTERPQYLENALKLNADYYITGFLTPLGAEISMITQVVSTHSGSVVYSTTISARTYADAAGQADLLHDAIIRHAGRGLAALDAPPPAPTSSPQPEVGSKGVNIFKALGHHDKSTPAPSPSGSAPPRARMLVVLVSGDAEPAVRTSLGMDLSKSLVAAGFSSGYLPVAESDVRAHAGDLCKANAGTSALLVGTLVVGHAMGTQQSVALDVTAYDCAGAPVAREHTSQTTSARNGLAAALHAAAATVAAAFAKTGIPAKPF